MENKKTENILVAKKDLSFLYYISSNNGFIFVEILIAVSLIGIVFITLIGIAFSVLKISDSIKITNQMDFLARESLESVRSFRDTTTWSVDGLGSLLSYGDSNPYHLEVDEAANPPKLKLVLGSETIGNFTRSVIFDKVSRDLNGGIVLIPAKKWNELYGAKIVFAASCVQVGLCSDDPNTRKITVKIVYYEKTYQVITYLTNWQNK